MALVVTPGSASADSYLTVADADALAGEDLGPEAEAWRTAVLDTKERSLKRATREIDGYLRPLWPRYDETQALRFPRSVDLDASDDPMIPRDIELATYQQAIYVNKNHRVLAAANVRRMGADGTDESDAFAVDPDAGPSVLSPMALHYLADYQRAPSPSRRGAGIRSVRLASGFAGTR